MKTAILSLFIIFISTTVKAQSNCVSNPSDAILDYTVCIVYSYNQYLNESVMDDACQTIDCPCTNLAPGNTYCFPSDYQGCYPYKYKVRYNNCETVFRIGFGQHSDSCTDGGHFNFGYWENGGIIRIEVWE